MSTINENRIIQFLSGQATEQEKHEIISWKNENAKNKKLFKEIEVAFNTSEIIINPEKFDVAKAYPNIQAGIKENYKIPITLSIVKKVVRYAAIVIFTIGLTWLTQKYILTDSQPKIVNSVVQSVETPAGAKSLITLEDGTKIWLNANSKLTYPTHFASNERKVYLEGEGYFDVAKDKKWPFKVETSNISINVLGTIFNVKSYPQEGMIETTLIEGEIILNKILTDNSEQEILKLNPSEKAIFIKKEGILLKDEVFAANIPTTEIKMRSKEKIIVDKNVQADHIVAWKDNKMIFKNETFESIAVRLERRFGAIIQFKDEDIKGYRFSGTFDEISIDQALKALQFASPFNFEINQNLILIQI